MAGILFRLKQRKLVQWAVAYVAAAFALLKASTSLNVISRTSTMKYASHPDDLKTIVQQLGVALIGEPGCKGSTP